MSWIPITCEQSEIERPTLSPLSGLTNWVGGEQLNPHLPPMTCMTWGDDNGNEIMRDVLDADGCRHWVYIPAADERKPCLKCATRPDASFSDPEAEPCTRCGDTGYIIAAAETEL